MTNKDFVIVNLFILKHTGSFLTCFKYKLVFIASGSLLKCSTHCFKIPKKMWLLRLEINFFLQIGLFK